MTKTRAVYVDKLGFEISINFRVGERSSFRVAGSTVKAGTCKRLSVEKYKVTFSRLKRRTKCATINYTS